MLTKGLIILLPTNIHTVRDVVLSKIDTLSHSIQLLITSKLSTDKKSSYCVKLYAHNQPQREKDELWCAPTYLPITIRGQSNLVWPICNMKLTKNTYTVVTKFNLPYQKNKIVPSPEP